MVKNLRAGSRRSLWEDLHAAGQLSPPCLTAEPVLSSEPYHHNGKEQPPLPEKQLEETCAATKALGSQNTCVNLKRKATLEMEAQNTKRRNENQ